MSEDIFLSGTDDRWTPLRAFCISATSWNLTTSVTNCWDGAYSDIWMAGMIDVTRNTTSRNASGFTPTPLEVGYHIQPQVCWTMDTSCFSTSKHGGHPIPLDPCHGLCSRKARGTYQGPILGIQTPSDIKRRKKLEHGPGCQKSVGRYYWFFVVFRGLRPPSQHTTTRYAKGLAFLF
jgi:hypothetical protein